MIQFLGRDTGKNTKGRGKKGGEGEQRNKAREGSVKNQNRTADGVGRYEGGEESEAWNKGTQKMKKQS